MLISTKTLIKVSFKGSLSYTEDCMCREPSQKTECVTFGRNCFHPSLSFCGSALLLPLKINLIDNVDTSNEL